MAGISLSDVLFMNQMERSIFILRVLGGVTVSASRHKWCNISFIGSHEKRNSAILLSVAVMDVFNLH